MAKNVITIGKTEITLKEGDSPRLSDMIARVRTLDHLQKIFDQTKVRYFHSPHKVTVVPDSATGVGLCFIA